MTDVRINNGALVHRIWSRDEAEFLAAFQYSCDAITFAEGRVALDEASKFDEAIYVVTDTGTGKCQVRRSKAVQP